MRLRILMAAHDGAPGGGGAGGGSPSQASPSPTGQPSQAAPTPPAKQGDAPLTMETLTPVLRQLVRDAINADTRRSGQSKPNGKSDGKSEPNTGAPAPTFDPARYREMDRAVARAGMADKLSGSAYKRMERAFADESPDDAEAWVTDYFAGFGVAKSNPTPPVNTGNATSPTNPTNPTNPANPTTPPVSDRGAPPAVQTPIEERDLATISAADRQSLINSKGLKWYVETLARQQAGKRVKFT